MGLLWAKPLYQYVVSDFCATRGDLFLSSAYYFVPDLVLRKCKINRLAPTAAAQDRTFALIFTVPPLSVPFAIITSPVILNVTFWIVYISISLLKLRIFYTFKHRGTCSYLTIKWKIPEKNGLGNLHCIASSRSGP